MQANDETKMLKHTKADIKGADLMLYFSYDKLMAGLSSEGVSSRLKSPNYI